MQYVNLYLPELRPRRDYFSAVNSVLAVCIALAFLTTFHLIRSFELTHLRETVQDMEAHHKALQMTVTALKQETAGRNKNVLQSEIDKTREVFQSRQSILNVMSEQAFGNRTGFSGNLNTLREKMPDGVTLEQFGLYKGGLEVRLEGVSIKAESVPLYLSQLQQDDLFRHADFGQMTLHNKHGDIRFVIGETMSTAAHGERADNGSRKP